MRPRRACTNQPVVRVAATLRASRADEAPVVPGRNQRFVGVPHICRNILGNLKTLFRIKLDALKIQAASLARQAQNENAPILDVLKLRARTSELTLKAANSAILHAGAKGYLMRHAAQRRLREAVFVAIVTPALKHLRKEIHDIEQTHHQAQPEHAYQSTQADYQTQAA